MKTSEEIAFDKIVELGFKPNADTLPTPAVILAVRAAVAAERLSREERIASTLTVLKEIVGDEQLCELMRESDLNEHGSTLGRTWAVIRELESHLSSKGGHDD